MKKSIFTFHTIATGVMLIVSLLLLVYGSSIPTSSQDQGMGTLYEARVITVIKEEQTARGTMANPITEQTLLIELPDKRRIEIVNDLTPVSEGSSVYVQSSLFGEQALNETPESFDIINIARTPGLMALALLFIIAVIMVSGTKGIQALVGLLFSLAIIFSFIIPSIIKGWDPVIISVLGAMIILFGTIWISYGINKKSSAALLGILFALLFVGFLATMTAQWLGFTGYTGDESIYLSFQTDISLNLVSLLIAGIIIAAIGVLDDVAVTQSSTVFALRSSNIAASNIDLFKKAMDVGQDHLSAVINTLFLAYAGASLPLLLLITLGHFPLGFTLSNEAIAQEIVRTILSTLGLVLAIPFTTAMAVVLSTPSRKNT